MKSKIFAAVVAASVSTVSAYAADLPSKKAAVAPPAPVSVNGFDFAWGGKLMSDYISRGVSQSGGYPSATAYGEARYNIGDTQLYAGIQGWAVKLPTSPSAEVDLYGGVRQTIGKFTVDLGGIYYWYPGNTNQYWINAAGTVLNQQTRPGPGTTFAATTAKDPSFLELYAKPSFNITDSFNVGANVYWSPNWNNYGFNSTYISGTAKYTFGESGFSVSGEYGRQYLGRTKTGAIFGIAGAPFQFPSYNTWNAGISYAYKVFTVDARYYGSSLSKAQCYAVSSDPKGNTNGGFSNWCGNRFMVSLSADMTLKDLSGPASAVVAKY